MKILDVFKHLSAGAVTEGLGDWMKRLMGTEGPDADEGTGGGHTLETLKAEWMRAGFPDTVEGLTDMLKKAGFSEDAINGAYDSVGVDRTEEPTTSGAMDAMADTLASKNDAGAGAFGNMSKSLTGDEPDTSPGAAAFGNMGATLASKGETPPLKTVPGTVGKVGSATKAANNDSPKVRQVPGKLGTVSSKLKVANDDDYMAQLKAQLPPDIDVDRKPSSDTGKATFGNMASQLSSKKATADVPKASADKKPVAKKAQAKKVEPDTKKAPVKKAPVKNKEPEVKKAPAKKPAAKTTPVATDK